MRILRSQIGGFLFAVSLVALHVGVVSRAAPAPSPAYLPDRPLRKVATLLLTWHDPARNRDVPVKIYYPENARSACPMIIFSHGLGGSRLGYSYLGQYWAGCGYISVHLQHHGERRRGLEEIRGRPHRGAEAVGGGAAKCAGPRRLT